ncbi:hypothetical protein ACS0TY_028747 [Phlomoides rotata]
MTSHTSSAATSTTATSTVSLLSAASPTAAPVAYNIAAQAPLKLTSANYMAWSFRVRPLRALGRVETVPY